MVKEAERYNFVREKSGLSKKDFAETLGLSFSMNYQISSGRTRLPRDLLERLARAHKVNLHWYLTGEGNHGMENDTVEIELHNQEAAAGQGREVQDHIEREFIPVMYEILRPHRPEDLKAVRVSGDSMIDERINDGDIVIFTTRQKEGNGIYVVSIGTTLVVKRVDFDLANNTIVLISANPAYEPRRFSGEELNDIKIEGKVVVTWHKL